jgi:uncharacterized membrane protein
MMDRWSITFLQPAWLVGLAILPVIVGLSYQSLAGLGPVRRWLAIACRSMVIALILTALADVQWVGESRQVCTLFLLDQSQSIPPTATEQAIQAISRQIADRPRDRDLAGVIVFGKEARVELPPALYPRDQEFRRVTASLDRQYSDLGSAIQLALGSLPPNTAGRLVLFTDGNQNRGNVLAEAAVARRNKVPIDVVPIEYRYDAEILVDKVVVPAELRPGDTANIRVVIRSSRDAAGLLRLNRIVDGARQVLAEERVTLKEGLNVKFVKLTIDDPSLSTFEASFEPEAASFDTLARNNTGTGFSWIRGEGRVLLIAPAASLPERLVESLRQDRIAVVTRSPEQLSDDLAELAPFDAVILANVPAESLGEKRQQILATSVRSLGTGLLMIGGPDSFGPGGYNGSPLEEALPVQMEVQATKITSKGALVLIMHACEMPEGNFWQKKVAQLAVKQLSSQDECGLLHWNGTAAWSFKLQGVGDRSLMNGRIDRMVPGDMPDFAGTMQMGFDALKKSDALTKHVIIISDGDPAPPSNELLGMYKQAKISVTTVAIAAHGAFEERTMNRIAATTGGRSYRVTSPKALPEIYIKETRSISRPLIFERPEPWRPTVDYGGEPVAGLGRQNTLPPIRGFVLTTPKPTAIVEVSSPIPVDAQRPPILAHWQYGLGRAVALTTDAGERWASEWVASDIYGKFWSQLIRWTMRPAESDRLTLATNEKDGVVRVVVNAATPAGEFLNGLAIDSAVVGPDGASRPLPFRQTEPGKYEATYPAEEAGTYVVRLATSTGEGSREVAFAPHSVSYPPEYRETTSRRDLAESVALVTEGKVIEPGEAATAPFFAEPAEPIRRLQDAWPMALLTALVLLWMDVAVRRISVDPRGVANGVQRVWNRWRGRTTLAPIATLDRLKSVKAELSQEFQQRRSFGGEASGRPVVSPAEPVAPPSPGPAPPTLADADSPSGGETSGEGSHTSRLLRAKKQVWENREKDQREEP